MLVYILDRSRPISGKISNSQLDLTLQYIDAYDKKEKLKHIYLKREDVGYNNSAGNFIKKKKKPTMQVLCA